MQAYVGVITSGELGREAIEAEEKKKKKRPYLTPSCEGKYWDQDLYDKNPTNISLINESFLSNWS